MQRLDLGPHLAPQLGIEVGQRLVEEEHLRIAHDGAAHGYTLALAARKVAGVALQIGRQIEYLGGLRHLLGDLLLGALRDPQAEAHVLCHRHVRVEGVGLEDHRQVTLLRR